MIDRRSFGGFSEPARQVLVALREGPRGVTRLLDEVRLLGGPIGPGTLFAAIARLERHGLIEPAAGTDGRRSYRLTEMETPA